MTAIDGGIAGEPKTAPLSERSATVLLLAGSLATRALVLLRYRIDSDEPQHLHVVWGWAHGLVQYRDVFDNHFPLFHILFAPLMAWSGERPDILFLARLWILPISLLTVLVVYALAARMYGKRAALWSAILLGVTTPWLLKSVEFRNDNLWVLALLTALLVIIAGERLSIGRALLSGLLLGIGLAVSLKTVIFLAAAVAALIAWRVAARRNGPGASGERRAFLGFSGEWKLLAAAAAGLVIVPILLAIVLWRAGAMRDFLEDAVRFNARLPVSSLRRIAGAAAFVPLLWILVRFARPRIGGNPRKAYVALLAAAYPVVLLCFWPLITTRDFLPIIPLLVMFGAAALAAIPSRHPFRYLTAATAAGFVATVLSAGLWRAPDDRQERVVAAALQLTRGDEAVFDLKGESVFRRRPVQYILEVVGRRLISVGRVRDDIPEQLVRNRCYVAIDDALGNVPARTEAFLSRYFIDSTPLRVSGAIVEVREHEGEFEIAVPGMFALTAPPGTKASIDGRAYESPVQLDAGKHVVQVDLRNTRISVAWAPAVARGFNPLAGMDLLSSHGKAEPALVALLAPAGHAASVTRP